MAAAASATVFAMAGTFASTATADSREAQQCVIVLDELQPGQTSSRVLSHTCTTGTQADKAHPAGAQDTLLMTWYADSDFNGASTQVRGDDGGCDSSGYGIAYVGDDWNDRISSWKLWGTCNSVTLYDNRNYGASIDYCGRCSGSNVALSANDRTSSMWIWHG
jgi:hypothetical protein